MRPSRTTIRLQVEDEYSRLCIEFNSIQKSLLNPDDAYTLRPRLYSEMTRLYSRKQSMEFSYLNSHSLQLTLFR